MSLAAASSAALLLIGLAVLAGLTGFGLVSIRERERRAAVIAFILAAVGSLPFFVGAALPVQAHIGIFAVLAGALVIGLALWFLPIGVEQIGNGRPSRRVDERDIMFARARLRPGSREFDTYYEIRPEHRASDDETRELPGLLSQPKSKYLILLSFAAH